MVRSLVRSLPSKKGPKAKPKRGAPPRRGQGRPTDAALGVGPEALIRAARELLQQLPPAKVTRAEVARHAGVDPALIRYYFRDRESLLLAVVQQIVGEHLQRVRAPETGTAPERLRAQIRDFFTFNTASPFFHRVLIEEIARAASKSARAAFHELNQFAIGRYAEILRDGEREHSLRAVDPALLHIAVVGMCEFFLASGVLLEDAFGRQAKPQSYAKRYAELVADLVIDGIQCR